MVYTYGIDRLRCGRNVQSFNYAAQIYYCNDNTMKGHLKTRLTNFRKTRRRFLQTFENVQLQWKNTHTHTYTYNKDMLFIIVILCVRISRFRHYINTNRP